MKWKRNAKKVTSFFLALVMVISLFAGFEFRSDAADYVQSSDVFADANGDGIINRLDPIRLRKNLTGSVSSNNTTDINGDDAVDALDLVLSKKIAAGELDEASFYSREISGDTYKFIFGRMAHATAGTMNELTWDAEENAYHYHIDGTVPNGYADRRLWFDASFVNKVIQYTGATSMTFDIKASAPQSTNESILYYTVSPTDYLTLSSNVVTFTPPTTYQTIEVNFSELPLDVNNNMMMPLLLFQHDNGNSVDLYISNITFHVPEDEGDVEYTVDTTVGTKYFGTDFTVTNPTVQDAAYTWSENYASGEKWNVCSAAASICGLKFTLKEPIRNVTSDMKLRLYIHGGFGDSGDAPFRLYHLDSTMHRDLASCVKGVAKENNWTYVTLDLSKLVDEDGTFRGFQFVDYNTTCDRWYFHYMEILTGAPVVEWEEYGAQVQFTEENVTFDKNLMTEVAGGSLHNSVNTAYTTDGMIYCQAGAQYWGRRFELKTPIKNVTDDMKLQIRVYAGGTNTSVDLRLYHIDYNGNANASQSYTKCSYTKNDSNLEASGSLVNGWQLAEFPLKDLIDADGTFRGFQIGSFATIDVAFYFNWIQIWRDAPDEVWEVHDTRDFSTADFTCTNVGLNDLHNDVSGAYTTLDGRDAYYFYNKHASSNQYPDFGRRFTLNTPISNVTNDMKLRMRVMVVGDGTTDAWFRLYNLSQTSLSNAGTYVDVYVPYSEATIVEIDITNLLDSDGTFSGFQLRNLTGSATVTYYFNWIDIVKLQEEFDPVDYTLDFKKENVTLSKFDLEKGFNYDALAATFTTEDSNNILKFANTNVKGYAYTCHKITFKEAIENCTEDMIATMRVRVTEPHNPAVAGATSVAIRLYKSDAYGLHSDNVHTELNIPVGDWTTVAFTLENMLVDGTFDGFFWLDFGNNYTIEFDELTICKTDDILEYGVSTYQLLTPADSSDIIDVATSEFNTFFKEATGTELAVVTDASVEGNQKYISIGETSLLKEAGIEYNATELGADGFKLVTKDNNIYAIGGSDYGTLYAVYELLSELVNYEYFYKDTYNLDTGVKEIAFKELNITEIPDIAMRVASDGVVSGDKMSLYRMRVRPYSESLLPIEGKWFHNSFCFVSGIASEGTTNTVDETNWFNDAKTQLCYTAHGNDNAYEAMLEACLNTLKGRIKKQPDKMNVVFSIEDNSDTCTCDACTTITNTYGAASATALLFLDDLQTKLDEWFATEDGKAYAGDLNIIFNAYKGYEAAPSGLTLTNDIKCLLSPIVADYYQPISANNATNATYYNTINDWGEFLNEGSLYVWYYGNNFRHYLAPYDSISNMQTNYQLAVANNATYLFEQRQHDETGFVTGWSNLKSYLSSKLAWDATADVTTLTSNFFNAYFGETAATHMKNYYDGLVALTSSNLNANNGFGGTKSVVQQDLCSSTYWPKATLETWLGYCDTALTSITDLQISDSELYNTYKAHIEGEKLAILYLYIETYLTYDNATAMASYISEAQTIAGNLGVTKYCEGGSISELFDKWGAVEDGAELVWTHGENTGISGVNNSGTLSYSESVYKISDCYTYSAHKLAFVEPQTYDGNETVSIKIKATPNTTGMDNLELILIPYDFTKTLSSFNIWIYGETVEVTTQGEWTTITFDIDKFLDDDGLFTGFGFVTSGYKEWSTGQMYTIEMEAPVVE